MKGSYDPKLVRTTHYNHYSCYMELLEHSASAQIAKYPKLAILCCHTQPQNAKMGFNYLTSQK